MGLNTISFLAALFFAAPSEKECFRYFWLAEPKTRKLAEHRAEDLDRLVPLSVREALNENPFFRLVPFPKNATRVPVEKQGIQICFDESRKIALFMAVSHQGKLRERAWPEPPNIFQIWEKIVGADTVFRERFGSFIPEDKNPEWRAKIFICEDPSQYSPMANLMEKHGLVTPEAAKDLLRGSSYFMGGKRTIFSAPFPGEARLTHEVVHMLVHLLSISSIDTYPFWLKEAMAWDVEKIVLGTPRSCCHRAGFVWARGPDWEKKNTGEIDVEWYLSLMDNPTDKDLVGILRFFRFLTQSNENFHNFLKDLESSSEPVSRIELHFLGEGRFRVTEYPSIAPFSKKAQEVLLLKHFGNCSGEKAELIARLAERVKIHAADFWIQCFKKAVKESPREKDLLESGMVLSIPGRTEALTVKEICELDGGQSDIEDLLAAVDKPFQEWAKDLQKRVK